VIQNTKLKPDRAFLVDITQILKELRGLGWRRV